MNLALVSRRRVKSDEHELVWDAPLPIASYALIATAAASWAIQASFAHAIGAVAVVILLITALRNSWRSRSLSPAAGKAEADAEGNGPQSAKERGVATQMGDHAAQDRIGNRARFVLRASETGVVA